MQQSLHSSVPPACCCRFWNSLETGKIGRCSQILCAQSQRLRHFGWWAPGWRHSKVWVVALHHWSLMLVTDDHAIGWPISESMWFLRGLTPVCWPIKVLVCRSAPTESELIQRYDGAAEMTYQKANQSASNLRAASFKAEEGGQLHRLAVQVGFVTCTSLISASCIRSLDAAASSVTSKLAWNIPQASLKCNAEVQKTFLLEAGHRSWCLDGTQWRLVPFSSLCYLHQALQTKPGLSD